MELDSLIFTYDINANTAFDIYNLPHKLELLNNFFHVVVSRQRIYVCSYMIDEMVPWNNRERP